MNHEGAKSRKQMAVRWIALSSWERLGPGAAVVAFLLALAAGCGAAPTPAPTPAHPTVAVSPPAPRPTETSAPTAAARPAETAPPTSTRPATALPTAAPAQPSATSASAGRDTAVPDPSGTPSPAYATITASDGTEVRVDLEVADTTQERTVGLSRRESLPAQAGMLFVFPVDQQAAFWMKDTFIPLSIAFISSDGVVLEIQDMEPLSEELHIPAYPYRYALEVNQGFFGEHGIEAGARIQFQLGGNS